MAARSRFVRPKRSPKKRPARKRPAAGKARKSAAAPGVVEAALAVFAHEVRTPLTGILAISDLLATSDLPERERRWADTIKAGAEHLASLATLFVDAAKDRNAATAIREDLFDLRAVARSAGDSLAGRAAAKGLQSRIELSEALPSLVVGDPVRLRAALENLIDNAVKFTEAGGAITVTLRRKDDTAVITIQDNGRGIAPDQLSMWLPCARRSGATRARLRWPLRCRTAGSGSR
jgi:signal transduction histidine kinase